MTIKPSAIAILLMALATGFAVWAALSGLWFLMGVDLVLVFANGLLAGYLKEVGK